MNKDLLVEIFAHFGSNDGKGKVSTGYPVAKDRILTARHGLYDENDNVAGKIEVRWYYHREKEGHNWQVAEIVDCGLDKALDVELLKCTFPAHINPDIRFAFTNPGKAFDWEGEGFAAAGKRDELRPPTPLAGETYHAADGATWLQLTEKGKAEVPELWRGISGAPVFRKSSNELMGVVIECPDNFNAIRLYATPLWKLVDNPQFCKAIAKAREQDLQKIRRDLQAILDDSSKLKEALAIEMSCSEVDLVNTLIEDTKTDDLLKYCEQVILKLEQSKEQAAISKGKALVNYLLPIVFDSHIINVVCNQSKAGVCQVAIGTGTVAEIIMAGKDGRATKYRPLEPGDDPVGEYLLDSPAPNQGIGSTGWIEEFKRQIINDYARLDALDDSRKRSITKEQELKLAIDALKRYANKYNQTRYYIYSPPPTQKEHNELRNAIEDLHRELNGHVVFLECGDFDLVLKERDEINDPLINILKTEVEDAP